MKVVLRHEVDAEGVEIGDVPPDRLMEVFEQIKRVGVYDEDYGGYHVSDMTPQILYGSGKAVFEIVISGEK